MYKEIDNLFHKTRVLPVIRVVNSYVGDDCNNPLDVFGVNVNLY